MKKLLFVVFLISSLWAGNIKTNDNFISINVGSMTLVGNNNNEKYVGGSIGYYFYDENPYLISNRLYFNGTRILKDNSSLYMGELNLDWIFNQLNYIKPFLGANVGYLYDNDNTDNSTTTYGFNIGILLYIGDFVELEAGAKLNHPINNSDVWPNNFKKIYGSINISF